MCNVMDQTDLDNVAVLAIEYPGLALLEHEEGEGNLLGKHRERIEKAATSHGGELVKTLGDNFTLVFPRSSDAVRCALALLSELGPSPSEIKMGIHRGPSRRIGSDLIGKAADGALALKSLSSPGFICASAEVVSDCLDTQLFSTDPLPERRRQALPAGLVGYLLEPAAPKKNPTPSPMQGKPGETAKENVSEPKGPGPKGTGTLGEIRASILEDIRSQGRRLSVDEALSKYGWYGPEATEVIAQLAESGILVGRKKSPESAGTSASPASFSSGDIGKSIEAAIHAIVSEVERSVSQGIQKHSGPGFTAGFRPPGRPEFPDSRSEEAIRKVEAKLEATLSKRKAKYAAAKNSFAKYRDELKAKSDKAKRGIAGSIISFLTINPILWYINVEHARGFPWAPIVSIFWGSGVLDHIFGAFRSRRQSQEAEALPDLDEAETKELKSINKERDSIAKHALNAVTIPGALFFINMASNSDNPWFVIPSAIMAISFFIHLATYLGSAPRKRRNFFERVGIRGGKKGLAEARQRRASSAQDLGNYSGIYDKAWDVARDIEADLTAEDPKSAKEMKPALDAYLGQVLLLAKTANELDAIIGEIPMEALAKDKATLASKLEKAPQTMQAEYRGSIAEIEKQEESFRALKDQREVIDLRLQSSVNQLNQLKMDMVRAKAADRENSAALGESALNSIKARAEELSLYIDDLKKGHLEALSDPFAELEKTYGTKDLLEGGTTKG